MKYNAKMNNLSNKLRHARKSAGLSQKELGEKLKISEMAISAYETGRAIPPLPSLKRISKITKFPLIYFIEDGEKSLSSKTFVKNIKKIKNTVIGLALAVGALKKIYRQGWALKGIREPESVADHSFLTAFLSIIISKGEKTLDQTKLVKMALIHELGEVMIGDVVYEHGEKIISPLVNKHRGERNAVRAILKNIENNQEYIDLWEEWVDQKTPESKFLKKVEKIEMAIQAYEYERSGYDSELFSEFWENAWKYIRGSELESLLQELETMRKKK